MGVPPQQSFVRARWLCHSCAVSAAAVVALVLGMLLVVAAGVIVVLVRRLGAARAEAAELQAALEYEHASPRGPRAAKAAGMAVRSVVETAHRVREQGVRGMLLSSIDDFATWATEDRQEIARVAASDGTVSIMFSDIENSTPLNSELGDRASLGIPRALGAKRQRSRQLRRTPISVRIGLHTGTAIEREGDYFGRNGAMAARVAGAADGGPGPRHRDRRGAVGQRPPELERTDVMTLRGLPGERQLWAVTEG